MTGRKIKGQMLEKCQWCYAQGGGEYNTHVVMAMNITDWRSSMQSSCTNNALTSRGTSKEGQRHNQMRGINCCYRVFLSHGVLNTPTLVDSDPELGQVTLPSIENS